MKLVTQFELARMSINEIISLRRKIELELAKAPQGSVERLNSQASLLHIGRELAMRLPEIG